MHKIVVVTPAGRKRYLELLKGYILDNDFVSEWHLWDNCRHKSDRDYIESVARDHAKIRIVRLDHTDGTNKSVNLFYKFAADEDKFYFKLDDDIVYIQPGTFERLYEFAVATKDRYIWWSPLVINNPICSWIIKHQSKLHIAPALSAQASDSIGWRSPYFAHDLHLVFLEILRRNQLSLLDVGTIEISASRFSINFIGFFGTDVKSDIGLFCPPLVDDEDWISAVLPMKLKRYGALVGDRVVSHFSFYTQERYMVKSQILKNYYQLSPRSAKLYKDEFSKADKIKSWQSFLRALLVQRLLVGPKPKTPLVTFKAGTTHG